MTVATSHMLLLKLKLKEIKLEFISSVALITLAQSHVQLVATVLDHPALITEGQWPHVIAAATGAQ